MRVLLSSLNNDRVELNLARVLHESGVEVQVICQPHSPAEAWCDHYGMPHQALTFRHRFDGQAVAAYRKLLTPHRFDLVHCFTNRALSTALLATRGHRSAPPVIAYRGTMGHLHRWDPASRMSYLHPRVHTIICVSDAVRGYLREMGIPDERLEVIWKGHDPSWYPGASREGLADLGLPPSAVVVGFTGNIRPVKGVDYLLRAFAGIDPAEKVHLLIIGEVRDRRVARQIGRLPHVHFLGYRSDAARLSGACDLVVMPSVEREGLPKAVIEAMAQGIPPVVTRVGGLPELVEDHVSGRVVPPRDVARLREAILALARAPELRQQLGAAARQRIAGPFHFQRTAEKTLKLYNRILAASPRVGI